MVIIRTAGYKIDNVVSGPMRLGVISDSHLGYGYESELGEDAFKQFQSALEQAIAANVDVILLAGDIFDSRTPRQEVLARAMSILQLPLLAKKNNTKLIGFIGKEKDVSPIVFSGIPVVAIHGTHERRGTQSINPIEALEEGGYLIHLHCAGVMLDVDGKRLAVQGMSGVPEQYVKSVLDQWAPKPVDGARNVFMFHQSLKEYIYAEGETFISVADLPKGFDAYIDGHIHWKSVLGNLFFPGSTVITQRRKNEAETPKGFFIIDFPDDPKILNYEFMHIKGQRPFYFLELSFDNATVQDIMRDARKLLQDNIANVPKPLVLLKIKGVLGRGLDASAIDESEITKGFDAFITVKKELGTAEFRETIDRLRQSQKERLSVDERGMQLIGEMLSQTAYSGPSPSEVIDELAEGDTDSVIEKIVEGH